MKRSITLLISNIFATIWTLILLYFVCSFFAKGGATYFVWANRMNYFLSDLLVSAEDVQIFATLLNGFYILASLYVLFYVIATILGWVGYATKSSGPALAAAILFLIGTLFCIIFLLFSLHIIVLSFVGQGCQRKLKKLSKNAPDGSLLQEKVDI